MDKLKIRLENCYGIKKLQHDFDFTKHNSFVVYASNGSMKTSFAKTFKDLSNGKIASDEIFPTRDTIMEIKDETGKDLTKDEVFVIKSYEEEYKPTNVETLLINKEMKQRYNEIFDVINNKKAVLIKKLQEQSGIKKNPDEVMSLDMVAKFDVASVFEVLESIQFKLKRDDSENPELKLATYKYGKIFNEKSADLLQGEDFKSKLENYIKTYDALLASSTFFKKDTFDHNNAADVVKNLKKNGLLKAGHKLLLFIGGEWKEITDEKELEKMIEAEKESILSDKNLKKSYEEVNTVLTKNESIKDFADYIKQNQGLLSELSNIPLLKRNLWTSYLLEQKELCIDLIESYSATMDSSKEIKAKIKEENSKWQDVVDKFNRRFYVPFRIDIEDKEEKILGLSDVKSFKFVFEDKDTSEKRSLKEDEIKSILSQGERRALYLLNVIFDIETRKELNKPTLFVVDDIADSFDYQNKYAIIEYLKDIAEENKNKFYQIILTHNYDFYRTISQRLLFGNYNEVKPHKLHAVKYSDRVELRPDKYQKNPFDSWKQELSKDNILVASIPFIRNLTEYCSGNKSNEEYNKLTSLLHIKADTSSILVKDLSAIINTVIPSANVSNIGNQNKPVKEIIYNVSDEILKITEEFMELENKIVLSIAIRLKAEEFMIGKIKAEDPNFIPSDSNQTIDLIKKYRTLNTKEEKVVLLVDRVNLMTPENIHLNSFMYEPILDMSNRKLKEIYSEISALQK